MFFNSVSPSGINYVDRGDIQYQDFVTENFTKDGDWHDLDLSGIVPSETKLVLLRLLHNVATDTGAIFFRKNGSTHIKHQFTAQPGIANKSIGYDVLVCVDADGKAEYRASVDTHTVIDLIVVGWFV